MEDDGKEETLEQIGVSDMATYHNMDGEKTEPEDEMGGIEEPTYSEGQIPKKKEIKKNSCATNSCSSHSDDEMCKLDEETDGQKEHTDCERPHPENNWQRSNM